MRGSKTKYRLDFPKRAEAYAKEGMIDKEIAMKLGIALTTFYRYQNDHRDFRESIRRGKDPVDEQVEKALLKRALGFEYEETTVEYIPAVEGQTTTIAKTIKKVKKQIVPDVTADKFWLINRMPERWRDKTETEVIIKGASIEEMKKNITEANKDD